LQRSSPMVLYPSGPAQRNRSNDPAVRPLTTSSDRGSSAISSTAQSFSGTVWTASSGATPYPIMMRSRPAMRCDLYPRFPTLAGRSRFLSRAKPPGIRGDLPARCGFPPHPAPGRLPRVGPSASQRLLICNCVPDLILKNAITAKCVELKCLYNSQIVSLLSLASGFYSR